MWYLYENKAYRIEEYDQYVGILRTEAIYILPKIPMFREYIRGISGIAKYGQHIQKLSLGEINTIKENGKIIPEPCLEKRLRYSETDGGKHFDTYRNQIKNITKKILLKMLEWWKDERC